MIKTAIISECGKHRYQLTRTWDDKKPKVAFIMLNPSTADADNDDPTIRRCINFAKSWGYGGIEIYNLYSYRATNPKDLITAYKNDVLISDFKNFFSLKCIALTEIDVIFAWGSFKHIGPVVYDVIDMFPNARCIKHSKDRNPCHPLYLKSDLKPIPFKT